MQCIIAGQCQTPGNSSVQFCFLIYIIYTLYIILSTHYKSGVFAGRGGVWLRAVVVVDDCSLSDGPAGSPGSTAGESTTADNGTRQPLLIEWLQQFSKCWKGNNSEIPRIIFKATPGDEVSLERATTTDLKWIYIKWIQLVKLPKQWQLMSQLNVTLQKHLVSFLCRLASS